ncbi:MAG: glycosyltransferase [Pedobacter sp.]|nr:MAG: glycosyltransferase [Pedobacter sp.]
MTKDHTHFSPGLLWRLRREIRQQLSSIVHRPSSIDKISTNNNQRLSSNVERPASIDTLTATNEQRIANNDLIIHIHAWWNLVSIFSCWVAKWYNVSVVLSPRGMLTEYTLGNRNVGFKYIMHWLIGKRLLKYCHIHATSEKEKEDILKFIKPRSVTVIANLVELESSSEYQVSRSNYQEASNKYQAATSDYRVASIEYQEAKKQRTQQLPDLTTPPTFRLIFLSRIEEKKGLELLFEALAKFDVDWSLTIAGSGEKGYVEGLGVRVEGLGISTRINWVGQVKNEDKFKLLAEHDLMVLTSYNENFANVVIESLSVGTTVVLSKDVGLADYVMERDLGWVTSLTTESIRETLTKAYLAVDHREKMRVQAPQLIREDFNDEVFVKRYVGLYEEISLGFCNRKETKQ